MSLCLCVHACVQDLALKGSGRGRGGRDDMGSKPGSRESTPLHTPGVKPTIAKKPGTSTYKAGTAVHKWRKAAREAGNALGESAVDYVAFLIGSYGESTYKLHTQHQLPQVVRILTYAHQSIPQTTSYLFFVQAWTCVSTHSDARGQTNRNCVNSHGQ